MWACLTAQFTDTLFCCTSDKPAAQGGFVFVITVTHGFQIDQDWKKYNFKESNA